MADTWPLVALGSSRVDNLPDVGAGLVPALGDHKGRPYLIAKTRSATRYLPEHESALEPIAGAVCGKRFRKRSLPGSP